MCTFLEMCAQQSVHFPFCYPYTSGIITLHKIECYGKSFFLPLHLKCPFKAIPQCLATFNFYDTSSYISCPFCSICILHLHSFLAWDLSSGSSHRGGAAAPAPRQTPQSPVAHLELPDLCVEDTLELQLQQLTLAQFTVATMQFSIPLLKTGSGN